MKKLLGILACGVLLAGCGADVEGRWQGTWADNAGNSGELMMQLRMSGSEVVGTLTSFGLPCISAASVSGSVDGEDLEVTATQASAVMKLDGKADGDSLSGSFTIESGGACVGAKGTFEVTR